MTLSCLYPKVCWLISHDQLSFHQPLLVNVLRRLSDSRGDMAVPVRIKFITLCMFQIKFLISFTPVTCLSCYRIILLSSLINFTYSRMGFVDTLNLFLLEYTQHFYATLNSRILTNKFGFLNSCIFFINMLKY